MAFIYANFQIYDPLTGNTTYNNNLNAKINLFKRGREFSSSKSAGFAFITVYSKFNVAKSTIDFHWNHLMCGDFI